MTIMADASRVFCRSESRRDTELKVRDKIHNAEKKVLQQKKIEFRTVGRGHDVMNFDPFQY